MSYFSLNKIGFSYEGKVVLEDIHFSVEREIIFVSWGKTEPEKVPF